VKNQVAGQLQKATAAGIVYALFFLKAALF
jgi:hypothetical protein